MTKQSQTIMILVLLFVSTWSLALYAAYDYLTTPIVQVDQTNKCRWVIYQDMEKRTCPLTLPDKYTKEYIWLDDNKGSQDNYK